MRKVFILSLVLLVIFSSCRKDTLKPSLKNENNASIASGGGGAIGTPVFVSDEIEPSMQPIDIMVGASVSYDEELILNVSDYWAQPEHPITSYQSNGYTITRKTAVMDLRGSASPLPGFEVVVTWSYIINNTYSYSPYSPPKTRQKGESTTMIIYRSNF